jgi:hypothetical protein
MPPKHPASDYFSAVLEGTVSLRVPGASPAGALAATVEGIFLHVIAG